MFRIRVEFEPRVIRGITVECPQCKKWFFGSDVIDNTDDLDDEIDLQYATFTCPICSTRFGYHHCRAKHDKYDIEECSIEEMEKDALQKKNITIWERKD